MRALIQRVSEASVAIGGEARARIGRGLLILVGIEHDDGAQDCAWLASKIVALRIFDDSSGVMNLDIRQIDGDILVISQFTLHASTKKGNRPSYIRAARPETAMPLYENFMSELSRLRGKTVLCGEFGADMQVASVNDGPVTIWIDSRNRE